jgi:hypothetical protein
VLGWGNGRLILRQWHSVTLLDFLFPALLLLLAILFVAWVVKSRRRTARVGQVLGQVR